MAFIRFHNKGLNTDWIVRWEDDDAADTLRVVPGVSHARPPCWTLDTDDGGHRP